jgi:hypothetical protein
MYIMKPQIENFSYIDKYKKYLTSYKTKKTSLNSIIKYPHLIKHINDVVHRVNKIIIHTYQFLKLYILHYLTRRNVLATIDHDLVKTIIKVLCSKDPKGAPPSQAIVDLTEHLTKFYNKYYKPTMVGKDNDLRITYIGNILEYQVEAIITNYENHIRMHFFDLFDRYINVLADKYDIESHVKSFDDKVLRKRWLSSYRRSLRRLKTDIYDNENKCGGMFHRIKKHVRDTILKDVPTDQPLADQVKSEPLKFLGLMVQMNIEIEKRGLTFDEHVLKHGFQIGNMENECYSESKLFSCFPLKKSIIPPYIKLDTTSIIQILHDYIETDKNKSFYLTKGNIKKLENEIWGFFFKTNKEIFTHEGYKFHHSLMTDGFACSILFIREDLYNPSKVVKIRHLKKPYNYKEDPYIDELSEEEILNNDLKQKTIVGIDPGKDDLIYCTNGINKEIVRPNGKIRHVNETFRYSQNQRRFETKSKVYSKIKDNDKKDTVIGDKTVKEIESLLSNRNYNSKTCNYESARKYTYLKNLVNSQLYEYYNKNIYRQLNWYSFINTQRSEARMLHYFKEKFGKPKEVAICIGDYAQRKHIKFKEPTKGKGMRRLFRRAGYDVYLGDEYNSSAKSFLTGTDTEKFRKRGSPRPWRVQNGHKEVRLWHGLIRSKNDPSINSTKHTLFNRDFNGSMGILTKAYCAINAKELPKHYKRKTK